MILKKEGKVLELLTMDDMAKICRVKKATIWRWVRLRKLPHLRIGKNTIRFSEEEINRWIKSKTKKSVEEANG